MKKEKQEIYLSNRDLATKKDFLTNSIKTTNINILLNRVRQDRKRTLKKRIIFLVILITLISLTAVYLNFWSKKFIETIKIYIISHLILAG